MKIRLNELLVHLINRKGPHAILSRVFAMVTSLPYAIHPSKIARFKELADKILRLIKPEGR